MLRQTCNMISIPVQRVQSINGQLTTSKPSQDSSRSRYPPKTRQSQQIIDSAAAKYLEDQSALSTCSLPPMTACSRLSSPAKLTLSDNHKCLRISEQSHLLRKDPAPTARAIKIQHIKTDSSQSSSCSAVERSILHASSTRQLLQQQPSTSRRTAAVKTQTSLPLYNSQHCSSCVRRSGSVCIDSTSRGDRMGGVVSSRNCQMESSSRQSSLARSSDRMTSSSSASSSSDTNHSSSTLMDLKNNNQNLSRSLEKSTKVMVQHDNERSGARRQANSQASPETILDKRNVGHNNQSLRGGAEDVSDDSKFEDLRKRSSTKHSPTVLDRNGTYLNSASDHSSPSPSRNGSDTRWDSKKDVVNGLDKMRLSDEYDGGRHSDENEDGVREGKISCSVEGKLSVHGGRSQNNNADVRPGENSRTTTRDSGNVSVVSSRTPDLAIASARVTSASVFDRLSASGGNHGLTGLANLGNTCFMNSILQCLSNTRFLLKYCMDAGYKADINRTTSRMKGAMFIAYANLMTAMWGSSVREVVSPSEFKNQISKFARRFVGYSEQDAHEFLVYLLEGLHEDVNRVTEKRKRQIDCSNEVETISAAEKARVSWQQYIDCENSAIVDIFVGQLKSALTCLHCGYVSNTFEAFLELSLPIKRTSSLIGSEVGLSDCFEMFTLEETLDGDNRPTCAKCRTRRKCTKRFYIQKFPRVLVIHLKRFNQGSQIRTKLKTEVNCPLTGLDLGRFSSDDACMSATYSLYAVSNHTGTPMSGHYTAHAKHPFTNQWHYFNDTSVSPETLTKVNSSDAYLLFYERQSCS